MEGQDTQRVHSKVESFTDFVKNKWRLILRVTVGAVIVLFAIIFPIVLLAKREPEKAPPLFATGGDMLDFLVESGDISVRDGLLATWFHRANHKEDMKRALASDVMILEADVTLEGYGTANQKPIPIMAHPPNVTSDNTLDEWLDAVLRSRKGIKLDFKSVESVGVSLDLLLQKNNSGGIYRPVWLNADILKDPLIPGFWPFINATQFLALVQEKFPDVTLSLGWVVLAVYNQQMMEEMYHVVKDLPQKVTFPIQSLFVRKGWPYISWLLSQSHRFSLTLWQSAVHPSVEDLLFVRDNSHPARVYYDIYEPTLSQFKEAAEKQGRVRLFYPGGDLMDFLNGAHSESPRSSLSVSLVPITDRSALSAALTDAAGGGVLVVRVVADPSRPDVPVLDGPNQTLTLQGLLEELSLHPASRWGLYLRVGAPEQLGASLWSLQSFYSSGQLYRPVWVGMDTHHSFSSAQDFVSTVDRLFPSCTIVLSELQSALRLSPRVSQRVSLHLRPPALSRVQDLLPRTQSSRVELILETEQSSRALSTLSTLSTPQRHVYVMTTHVDI